MAKNPEVPAAFQQLGQAEQIGFLLKSLQHTLRQNIEEVLRKQGVELSFAHFAALFNLHYDPGISGAQLARRALVSAQTMNAALHTLERDGLLERRPHPDSRRADSWSLTDLGIDELERARTIGSSMFRRMLGTFDADEVAAFTDYLRRCIAALDDGKSLTDAALVNERPRRVGAQRRQKAGASSTRNV